jgi:hypothetical protein
MTRHSLRPVWFVAGVTLGAYLVGGVTGAAVGCVAAAVGFRRPAVPAVAALGVLATTALATWFEAPLRPGIRAVGRFVADRPLAAGLGRVAGVLFLVALACAVRAERPSRMAGHIEAIARRRERWFLPAAAGVAAATVVLALVGDRTLSWVLVPLLVTAGAWTLGLVARRRVAAGR